jgi:hypothetical protein
VIDKVKRTESGELTARSDLEQEKERALRELTMRLLPQMGPHWNQQMVATLKRQTVSRIIYYHELYKKIVDVPGVICEFGVQWGATLNLLVSLRGMLEPNNYSRHIFGFDTFAGFADVAKQDGDNVKSGDYKTPADYAAVLNELLDIQEFFCRPSHYRNFSLIEGDVVETFPGWLADNSHAVVAMAIFDMDVYAPTKLVLETIKPRLTKGSVLVFDELNCPHFPGETAAVIETWGLNNLALRRFPNQPYCSWAVFGE